MMDTREDLLQCFTHSLIKNFLALASKSGVAIHAKNSATHTGTGTHSNSENQQLVEELQKSIIRKLKKR